MKPRFLHPERIALPIALTGSALSIALFLLATHQYGPGLSADSVGYVLRARNLLAGDFAHATIPTQPPGFAAILALAGWLGLDPAQAFRPINAMAHGLSVFLGGYWMVTRFRNVALSSACTLALATAPMFLWANTYALSESVFGLLAIGALIVAGYYLEVGTRRALLLFAGLSALAVCTRLAGAPLLVVGGFLALARPGGVTRRRLADAAIFGTVSLGLVGPWLLYNDFVGDSMFGNRPPPSNGFGAVLAHMLGVAWGWFHVSGVHPMWFPNLQVPSVWEWVTAVILAVGSIVALASLAVRWNGPNRDGLAIAPLSIFVVVYLAFIVIVKARIGAPEYRYFVPALPPLILSIGWALDGAASRLLAVKKFAWLSAVLPLTVLGWIGTHQVPQMIGLIQFFNSYGSGFYSNRDYESADIVQFIRTPEFARLATQSVAFYSNSVDILYWEAGVTASSLPKSRGTDTESVARTIAREVDADSRAGRQSVLIWTDLPYGSGRVVAPREVVGVVQVVSIRVMPDRTGIVLFAAGPRQ